MKVLELKVYNGVWSAKELEKFLWDIENFFNAAKVQGVEKVSVTQCIYVMMPGFSGEQGLLK